MGPHHRAEDTATDDEDLSNHDYITW